MLHASDGIPECCQLVKDFEKCKAGGLPPPIAITSTAEREKEATARAAQEEEQRRAKEAAEKLATEHEETVSLETEMLSLLSPAVPDVSVGASEAKDGGKTQTLAVSSLATDLEHVHS